MGHPRPHFNLFSVFFLRNNAILQKTTLKNVHPVFDTGIWTHNLLNMSPLPLDQGSCPAPVCIAYLKNN